MSRVKNCKSRTRPSPVDRKRRNLPPSTRLSTRPSRLRSNIAAVAALNRKKQDGSQTENSLPGSGNAGSLRYVFRGTDRDCIGAGAERRRRKARAFREEFWPRSLQEVRAGPQTEIGARQARAAIHSVAHRSLSRPKDGRGECSCVAAKADDRAATERNASDRHLSHPSRLVRDGRSDAVQS